MNSCTLEVENEYQGEMDFMRALDAQLDVGESVRWIGRPQFMPMLISGVVRIIIGCVFAALSLPDVLLTLHKQDYSAQGLVPALFLLIGTGIALTPIINAFAVGRTTYAVTDRRLLILTHILRSRVQSFSANAINTVDVSEKADGSGSVTFRRDIIKTNKGATVEKTAFIGVRDVRSAAREIENLRHRSEN